MSQFFGRVSVEIIDPGTPAQREAFMLSETSGRMRELRPKVPMPIFFTFPQRSMFWKFKDKDVRVEGELLNPEVILATNIKVVQ